LAAPDERAGKSGSAPVTAAQPIEADELDGLFARLCAFRTLILAVSGGADSMALMLMTARWAQGVAEAPKIIVATVDHGLRAEARDEAAWVIGEARARGLEAHLLTWSGEKPSSGIQDAARTERYRLLCDLAETVAAKPAAIVTAHTEDDQAETLLMRLARGSGLDGLMGMPQQRPADARSREIALVRPLLRVSGARLRATLQAAGASWIEDPSNDAERFERVRVRKSRGALASLGLENDKLALSARRLARAGDALEACVGNLERAAGLDLHGGAYASLDAQIWRSAPEELRLRLLGRLIGAFGGQSEPVNLAQLELLVARMSNAGFEGATLGGAVVAPRGGELQVYRESGRHPLATLTLAPGTSAVWDGRFRVAAAQDAPTVVQVGPLGAEAAAQMRHRLDLHGVLPAGAAATLPAFRREGELLYVPVVGNFAGVRDPWDGAKGLYSAEFIG